MVTPSESQNTKATVYVPPIRGAEILKAFVTPPRYFDEIMADARKQEGKRDQMMTRRGVAEAVNQIFRKVDAWGDTDELGNNRVEFELDDAGLTVRLTELVYKSEDDEDPALGTVSTYKWPSPGYSTHEVRGRAKRDAATAAAQASPGIEDEPPS